MQESTVVRPLETQGTPLAVEMRDIGKAWPGVVANDHVDLQLFPGEVLSQGQMVKVPWPPSLFS